MTGEVEPGDPPVAVGHRDLAEHVGGDVGGLGDVRPCATVDPDAAHEATGLGELLDPVVAGVGDQHMAIGLDRDGAREDELALAVALRAPGAHAAQVTVELHDPMEVVVGDVGATVGVEGHVVGEAQANAVLAEVALTKRPEVVSSTTRWLPSSATRIREPLTARP